MAFQEVFEKKLAFLSYSIPLKVIKVGVLNYFGLNDHSMGRGSWKKELMELNFTFGFWFYNSKRPHSFQTATSNQKLRMKTVSCWSCAYSKLHLPKGGQSNLAFDLAKAAALLLKCRIKLMLMYVLFWSGRLSK